MPARTSDYWRAQVFSLFGTHPRGERVPASEIAREVEKLALTAPGAEQGRYPAERTIRGSLRDEWRRLSAEEQAQFGLVHWPQTFDSGLLPWTSARVVLDEAALWLGGFAAGLTLRRARWHSRLFESAPSAPVEMNPLHGRHLSGCRNHW